MGELKFRVYPAAKREAPVDLTGAHLTGRDSMPWPSDIRLERGLITCRRSVGGSAALKLRWAVQEFGKIVLSTTPLMERPEPYHLHVELAREKVRAVRNELAEWEAEGLRVAEPTAERVRQANREFLDAAAIQADDGARAARLADQALRDALVAAEALVLECSSDLLRRKKLMQPNAPPCLLGCRLPDLTPEAAEAALFAELFSYVTVDMTWGQIEPHEGEYVWTRADQAVHWCLDHRLLPKGGPLISFRPEDMPDWLLTWRGDFDRLLTLVCDYIETVVARFRDRVAVWEVVAAANNASVLNLSEEEVLRLTASAFETTKRVHPRAICVLTIADPWGHYLAEGGRSMSPLNFAEAMIRADVGVGVIGLDVVQGLDVAGGYCRDLLEVSNALDRYGRLGVPIHISTLAVPSAVGPDPNCRLDVQPDPADGGVWHRPWDPDLQALWLKQFLLLAISKPYTHAVSYADFLDSQPHTFPHAGLLDQANRPKPALEVLRDLRREHLAVPGAGGA